MKTKPTIEETSSQHAECKHSDGGYEIAPAYTVRIGDKLVEADGYSFEVVQIETRDRKNSFFSFIFHFAPQNGIGPNVARSGNIKHDAKVRVFRTVR